MSIPSSKSPRIRRPLLPSRVEWPGRGGEPSRAGSDESRSGMADYFAAAAAIVLGIGLLSGQLLFGGYGFLVFSLPMYFATGIAAVLGGIAVILRGEFPVRPACLVSSAVLGAYVWWRNAYAENLFPAINTGFLFAACGLAYLLLIALSKPSHRFLFWGIFLVAALAQSSLALIQVLNDPTLAPMGFLSVRYGQWMSEAVSFRATGFHVNPNALAWTLNIAALTSLSAAWWSRWGHIRRVLLFYVAAASLAMSVFAASRGGILSLGTGALVLAFLSFLALISVARRQGMVLGLVGIAVFALAGAAAWMVYASNPVIQDRFQRLFEGDERMRVAETAFRIFADHPIFGVGPGGFVYETRRFWRSDWWDFAHNDWAQLLCDYGWMGFSLVALFFVLHLWNGLGECHRLIVGRLPSSERGKSNAFALMAPAVAILCAAAVHSFFDFNTQISANAFLLAAVLGTVAGRDAPGFGGKISARLMGLIILCGGGLMIHAVYMAAPAEWHLLKADNATGRGDYAEAMREAQKGLDSDPRHARLWFMRGIADRLDSENLADMDEYLSRAEKSARAFEIASTLEPGEVAYDLNLIPILDLLGRSDQAEARLRSALSKAPFSGLTYQAYAKHLESAGQIKWAARYYQMSLRFPGATKEARQQLRELAPLLKKQPVPKAKPAAKKKN